MMDSDVDEAVVRDYLKDKVSRFGQLRDIRIAGSISRNPARKVPRNELPT